MIAKQGWRIMDNPNLLVSRVLKARYFPNSSFFDANLGYNPNYSWRNLWGSRDILKRGCRWVVGDGSRVRVMGELWLRREEGKWLRSPQVEEVHNLYVNRIMVEEDKLIWDENKEGRYVVREGYRMLMKVKWRQDERSASRNWNGLWTVNAPPKARHVLWR
ncbi:RNA-directed DNA polymerase (Reverse transcriptase), partial [Trifolium medium]|nr:RNA-directed DNA polymerase (Reverse transcriptase) [Trifolium medium]